MVLEPSYFRMSLNFYRAVRSLLDTSLAAKCTKNTVRIKRAKIWSRNAKNHTKMVYIVSYAVGQTKIVQEFLDLNFKQAIKNKTLRLFHKLKLSETTKNEVKTQKYIQQCA